MYSIDRIEGDLAILEQNGEVIAVPVPECPEGVREGDLLEQTAQGWELRRDAADERRNALAERRRRLLEGKR